MNSKILSSVGLILLLTNVNVVSLEKIKYECPQLPEQIPCVCIHAFANVFLTCTALQNFRQLQEAMQAMNGHGISELKILNSKLHYIPHNLFDNVEISRIRIQNSTMFYLFNKEFEKDSLKQIVLDDIFFEGGLDWNTLESLSQLQVLSVSSSGLEQIPYDLSKLALPVESLFLPHNDIRTVHDLAFNKLVNLKNLKMNDNFLTSFMRSMFPQPTSGLQYLDLSHNKLTSLPVDAFHAMPQLHSIILKGNKFVALEKTAVRTVLSSLFFFDVTENPLECDCQLSWLLSSNKPFHFHGWCSNQNEAAKRLSELSDEDFEKCDK